MSARQSRSSSIPIPRNLSSVSPSRNIESLISIPFVSPGRPQTASLHTYAQSSRIAADGHRGLGVSYGVRGSNPSTSLGSQTRPIARSLTNTGGIPVRNSPQSRTSTFEPRVVRATSSRSVDTGVCILSSSSSVRNRRSTSTISARSTSSRRPSVVTPNVVAPPVSFPRPAYLEHSALRHMLQTDSNSLIPSRKADPSSNDRRSSSYSSDSDDESSVSPPPREVPSTTPVTTSSDQILKLPTRWSEQVRHTSLNISADGRELAYQGTCGDLGQLMILRLVHVYLSLCAGINCNGDRDAAAARSVQSIPPACGIYYYEVEVQSKGPKASVIYIYIILFHLHLLSVILALGTSVVHDTWILTLDTEPDSRALTFDCHVFPAGRLIHGGTTVMTGVLLLRKQMAPRMVPHLGVSWMALPGCLLPNLFYSKRYDRMWSGLYNEQSLFHQERDFDRYRSSFNRIATLLTFLAGLVFENVGKDIEIYPSVGLQHSGDSVYVNFGHDPFKYDIEYHVQQQRNQTWAKILSTPVNTAIFPGQFAADTDIDSKDGTLTKTPTRPNAEDLFKIAMNKLVLSYLAHHGYAKTVHAFQSQCQNTDQMASGSSIAPSSMAQDHDIDMDDVPSRTSNDFERDIEIRTKIVNSVIAGDIDTALQETRTHHPSVLDMTEGLMLFKLRCRKFVELILEAAEMKKRMNYIDEGTAHASMEAGHEFDEDGMSMDVDDELFSPSSHANGFASSFFPIQRAQHDVSPTRGGGRAQYESALHEAIMYGQSLQADYKTDARPEVRTIFKRTFSIVAYVDPLEAGGMAEEVAGHQARVALATELNQAILSMLVFSILGISLTVCVSESQGKPTRPALEMIYRHTAVCVLELGILGNGSAAFADLGKEFLDAP